MMMKRVFHALVLLFAVACVAVRAAEWEEEEDVLVLTDDNFDAAVAAHDTLLVEFYAPWCGHCKSLAPEYAKAAKTLKENDPPIRIAKVDATAHTKVGERFGVQGFPTLKFFKGDVDAVKDYDGGRTADEIEKWILKKSGPAVKIVESADELEALKEANDVVVFAVLPEAEGEARSLFEKIADSEDLAVFAASTKTDITEDAAAVGKVVLYKKFDEGKNLYDGEFEKTGVAAFVKANSKPLVITFSQEKAPMIFGGDINEHVLVFVDATKDYVKDLEKALKAPAKETKGKLLHVLVPLTESRIVEYFGLKEADLPAIVLVNMAGGMKKFSFEYKADDFVAKIESSLSADLAVFEKSYLAGELKPTLKSAEPADDSDEAVKVIVGKDFQERVVESDKDVLLEFYAPWCGHCKSLAPKYEELAEAFADVDSIMIAKMDATENEVDHPGVDVKGFPTILFFPAKDKLNPITYEGARDVEGFTEFLKKNAKKFDLDGASHGVEHEELEMVALEEPLDSVAKIIITMAASASAASSSSSRRCPRRHRALAAAVSRALLLAVLCILSAPQSTVTAVQIPEQNGVLVLNESTFAAAAQSYDPLFVLFDSPARYGSSTLLRRFADAAQAVNLHHWNASAALRFAALDVSQLSRLLPSELRVLGLPAMLLFRCMANGSSSSMDESAISATLSSCASAHGGVDVYGGGRTSMEFQRYVLGQPLREAVKVNTRAQLDALVGARPFVVLFVVDGDDSQAFLDCRVLAQLDVDSSVYAVTSTTDMLSEPGDNQVVLSRVPSLVLFREFGRQHIIYWGSWNKAALQLFIQKNRYNLVSTYSDSDASYFYDRAAEAHVLLFSDPNDAYHPELLDAAQQVASMHYYSSMGSAGLRFVVVPKNQTTLRNALFVLDEHYPTMLIVGNVSEPPHRAWFMGDVTIELIASQKFLEALSFEIEGLYPAFGTVELPDEGGEQVSDWRDYSDLFVNRKTPIMATRTDPSSTTLLSRLPHSRQRRLAEIAPDSTISSEVLASDRDAFLSIFAAPIHKPTSASSLALRDEIANYAQIQLLLEQSPARRVLVVFHSHRCYSCRQAMDAIAKVPLTGGVDTAAIVNVDRVDVRDWPMQFEWLPGVFVVSADGRQVMMAAHTAITAEALIEFMQEP